MTNPAKLVTQKYLAQMPNILGGNLSNITRTPSITTYWGAIPAQLSGYYYQLGYRFATDLNKVNYVLIFSLSCGAGGACGINTVNSEVEATGQYKQQDPTINACKVIRHCP